MILILIHKLICLSSINFLLASGQFRDNETTGGIVQAGDDELMTCSTMSYFFQRGRERM
jgi:hypothetical protein